MSPTEFKKLKKLWYKKLKASGFHDIEDADNSRLKGGASGMKYQARYGEGVYQQTRQEYYYAAYQFLNSHEFDKERDRIIWEYHANGISARNIKKLLEKAGIVRFYKGTNRRQAISHVMIYYIIRKYRNIMLGKA